MCSRPAHDNAEADAVAAVSSGLNTRFNAEIAFKCALDALRSHENDLRYSGNHSPRFIVAPKYLCGAHKISQRARSTTPEDKSAPHSNFLHIFE